MKEYNKANIPLAKKGSDKVGGGGGGMRLISVWCGSIIQLDKLEFVE